MANLETDHGDNGRNMIRRCKSCGSCMNMQYAGKIQDQSTCVHVTFFKSGWVRLAENGEVENQIHEGRDRMPSTRIEKNFEEGWLYQDFAQQRQAFSRRCPHWNSSLRLLPIILSSSDLVLSEYEPELVALRQDKGELTTQDIYSHFTGKYLDLPAPVKLFIEQGMPTETIVPEKLFKNNVSQHPLTEVANPEKLLDYKPCSTCFFYKPSQDSEGKILQHKGICTREALDKGVFVLADAKPSETYTFLGCSKHLHPKGINLDIFQPLTSRMFPFVETNPFDLSADMMRNISRMPKMDIKPVFEESHFEALRAKDVFSDSKTLRNNINWNQAHKDLGLQPTFLYFAKNLKKHSQIIGDTWKPIGERYAKSEEVLFGKVHTDVGWATGRSGKDIFGSAQDDDDE